MKDFYDNLKELRTEFDLSQKELALKLNVSQSAVAKWELKKTEPTLTNIITICKYFDISADILLGLKEY